MKRIWRLLGLATAATLLVAPSAFAATPSPSMGHQHAGGPSLGSPAAELRVTLDRLLAEHAFLTIEQMRSGLTDGPDFAAAAKAVEGNSTDVAAAIGSIYGDAAVEPFGEIWRSHIGYLVDYAVSLGRSDADGAARALSGLSVYRGRIAEFLTEANPGVDLAGITEALDMHTAQLVEFIDAEHAGDHVRAYAIEREAYPHMFHVGDALAKVIASRFPDTFTGVDVAYSAAGTLRVTLDRILAEHAFLAAEAMRSGVAAAPDLDAALQAIAGNSDDLEGVVRAAYGKKAAAAFRRLWDGHISGYVAYIAAARSSDADALARARGSVNAYADELATFLADANPHLDRAALASLFRTHAGHLTAQVEAFVAADYDTTYELVRAGYEHMFDAGEALAVGIAAQMPKAFPADAAAPATDTESHAHAAGLGSMLAWLLAIVAVVLLAAFAAGRPVRARLRGR